MYKNLLEVSAMQYASEYKKRVEDEKRFGETHGKYSSEMRE